MPLRSPFLWMCLGGPASLTLFSQPLADGSGVGGMDGLVDGQRLPPQRARLVDAAQLLVGRAEVLQPGRLAIPVADGARDGQALLELLNGLLVSAETPVRIAEIA